MIRPKVFSIKKYTSISGNLIPIAFNKKFPIKVKRIFFIYGKKKYKRGDHAHKKCSQVFLSIYGRISVNTIFKKNKKKYFLDNISNKALFVPPKTWCSVKFLKKNSIVLVLTDYEYNFSDYIETFSEFLKH